MSESAGRFDASTFLAGLVRYLPGVLAIVLTVGPSVGSRLSLATPGLLLTVAIAVPPAALLASAITWSGRDPSGLHLLVVALGSWALFSLARVVLVDPAASRLVGSPVALLDLVLVWLGSYAVVGGVVYGTDWPDLDTDDETDRERSQPDPADD